LIAENNQFGNQSQNNSHTRRKKMKDNQHQQLFTELTAESEAPAFQELDNETAAACSGGLAYLRGPNPDVILFQHHGLSGRSIGANATTGDGIRNVGFSDGQGGGSNTAFNDITSSILIRRGEWRFFEHTNCQGGSILRGPGQYNLGFENDKISSFRRERP
jgi:Beta/Gamma crystallin